MADPRMDALLAYAVNEMGPGSPQGAGVLAGLSHRIDALLARISALERIAMNARALVGAGPPTSPPLLANPADGFFYVDSTNLRLYVRANGQWRWLGPMT